MSRSLFTHRLTSLIPVVLRALDTTTTVSIIRCNVGAPLPTKLATSWMGGRALSTEAAEVWGSLQDSFTSILTELDKASGVATVTINRPESLNALNSKVCLVVSAAPLLLFTLTIYACIPVCSFPHYHHQVMEEIVSACLFLDRQLPAAKVIIITGAGDKAFAAGADIKEMAALTYSDAYNRRLLNGWEALRSVRKPLIAAVNGYALGGGFELALMCDVIVAADSASLGQPEITLGVIPGMGGTQRLTRAVGKSRAMEMILTGARVSAGEATRMGLISRAVPAAELMNEVQKIAGKIAKYSSPAVAKAKECVNAAFEGSLSEGLAYEKREFWGCFALEDQKEGMAAFVQKRDPVWKNK